MSVGDKYLSIFHFSRKQNFELLLLKLRNPSPKKKKEEEEAPPKKKKVKNLSFVHAFLCNKSKDNCDVRGSFLSSKVRVRVILLITCMSQVSKLINFAYFKSLNS